MNQVQSNDTDPLEARLQDPDTRRTLGRLLDRIDEIEQVLDLLEQLPAVVQTTTDAVDDELTRAAERGVLVDQRAREGLALLERITQPQTAAVLRRLLTRTDQLDQLVDLLESDEGESLLDALDDLNSAVAETRREAEREGPPRKGPFGVLAALFDPDVQRALGFMTRTAKTFGRRLRR